MTQLLEVLFWHFTNLWVVFCLNSGCTAISSQESNFAEEVSGTEDSDESFSSLFVLDKAFAFALCNYEELSGLVSLLDLDLFWLRHDQMYLLYDEVFNAFVLVKNWIFLECTFEDKSSYFFFQRRFDHFEEVTKFVLVVQSLLDILKIWNDFRLEIVW